MAVTTTASPGATIATAGLTSATAATQGSDPGAFWARSGMRSSLRMAGGTQALAAA